MNDRKFHSSPLSKERYRSMVRFEKSAHLFPNLSEIFRLLRFDGLKRFEDLRISGDKEKIGSGACLAVTVNVIDNVPPGPDLAAEACSLRYLSGKKCSVQTVWFHLPLHQTTFSTNRHR